MIARNVTFADLENAAQAAGVLIDPDWELRDGPESSVEVRFTLALDRTRKGSPKFQGFKNGRHTSGVCWHGHRDFFRALFSAKPAAWVKTMLGTYNGKEHFERSYQDTGYIQVGRWSDPVDAANACLCEEVGS